MHAPRRIASLSLPAACPALTSRRRRGADERVARFAAERDRQVRNAAMSSIEAGPEGEAEGAWGRRWSSEIRRQLYARGRHASMPRVEHSVADRSLRRIKLCRV